MLLGMRLGGLSGGYKMWTSPLVMGREGRKEVDCYQQGEQCEHKRTSLCKNWNDNWMTQWLFLQVRHFLKTRKNRFVHESAISFYDHLSCRQLHASGGTGPKPWNRSWLLCLICFTSHIWSMSRRHILVPPPLTSALSCYDSGLH